MSTIGNGRTLPMTGWLLPWLKKNLIYCPELVDNYIACEVLVDVQAVECVARTRAQQL
jgi:hypothetical protein